MTSARTFVILWIGVSAAIAQQTAAPPKHEPADSVRVALRVVGPIDMSRAGEKGKHIDLYYVHASFENASDAPAIVFAPDIAKRPELARDWRFRGRRGTPHPYSIRIEDAKGGELKDARFAVFVGGFSTRLDGREPPPPICDYKEELDLLRLDARQKIERHLGYIVTKRGTPSDFKVEMILRADLADEEDAEAQRLIKLAGPERREFKCSAIPTPEEKKSESSDSKTADDAGNGTPPPPKPPMPPQPKQP